ncbi:MAG: zinc ribbon domain-containing protein [Anaerolineaceae bacterium]|nr:zinc ribbon domain-containing protein [Anaerolineaceae bacterium]MCY3936069.1 zinc ribbon domain-containing protein [Chloroflexota bacterium]MCY4105420.1 zinc ribbon domain-containing protein [Chloroflexota bacterium]
MLTWSLAWAAMPYYAAAVLLAIWATSIVWTYRDMQARSQHLWPRWFAAIFVGILTVPGMLIYWLMRPRETLKDSYARALEEEALLQEIERTASCPNCARATKKDWQICPQCHTQLRRSCHSCQTMLELEWSRCPSCLAVQTDTHVPQMAYSLRDSATDPIRYWSDEERNGERFQPTDDRFRRQPSYAGNASASEHEFLDAEMDFNSLENLNEY